MGLGAVWEGGRDGGREKGSSGVSHVLAPLVWQQASEQGIFYLHFTD